MTLAGEPRTAVPAPGVCGRARGSDLVTVLLVAAVVCLGLLTLPRLFGYGTLVVRSGSMAEAAPVGSLILARPLDAWDVRVGDVILIRREGATASPPVLHRVVSLAHRAGEVVVTTKGDSNATTDRSPYLLRGRTLTPVLAVPHAGRVLSLARTPVGWALLVAAPATVLLWMQLRAIWFPARRRSGAPMVSEHVPAAA